MPNDLRTGNGATESKPLIAPITLPKGGGAVRGIDEKFAANPVTGSASTNIRPFTSAARSDFAPELSLSYDSGNGNGPFGLGWRLSIPSISRRTEKGLPVYRDAVESNVFVLTGAEDLVPVLKNGTADAFTRNRDGSKWFETLISARGILPISTRTTWTSLCLAIAFALFLAVSATAGAVSGRIYGPDEKPVMNTTFTAKPAKRDAVEFRTDPSGNFGVYLDPGRYTVSPSADATLQGVIDSLPEPVQQDIHLKKGR